MLEQQCIVLCVINICILSLSSTSRSFVYLYLCLFQTKYIYKNHKNLVATFACAAAVFVVDFYILFLGSIRISLLTANKVNRVNV